MKTPVNQEDLNSQEEYFHHLNITSWKGRLYRKYFLYPLLNFHLKGKVLDIGCGLGSYLKSRKNAIGIDVNPFASSYLVGRLKWVDSLVGSNPSSSFMFITPCTDSPNTVLYRCCQMMSMAWPASRRAWSRGAAPAGDRPRRTTLAVPCGTVAAAMLVVGV